MVRTIPEKSSSPCFELTLVGKSLVREKLPVSNENFLSSIDQIDILLGISDRKETEDSSGPKNGSQNSGSFA